MTSLVQKRAPQWTAKAVVEGRIEERDSKAYEGRRAKHIKDSRPCRVQVKQINHITNLFILQGSTTS